MILTDIYLHSNVKKSCSESPMLVPFLSENIFLKIEMKKLN